MLLTNALSQARKNVFSITYVTHDVGKKKGGEVRTIPECVILGTEIWWQLYQRTFGSSRQPTQVEREQMALEKKIDNSLIAKARRHDINVAIVIGGCLTSGNPIKINIHLITAINGQEIFI